MKYEVDVYYSGFITMQMEAESEQEAIELARQNADDLPEDKFHEEFLPTLEHWEEADKAREVSNGSMS